MWTCHVFPAERRKINEIHMTTMINWDLIIGLFWQAEKDHGYIFQITNCKHHYSDYQSTGHLIKLERCLRSHWMYQHSLWCCVQFPPCKRPVLSMVITFEWYFRSLSLQQTVIIRGTAHHTVFCPWWWWWSLPFYLLGTARVGVFKSDSISKRRPQLFLSFGVSWSEACVRHVDSFIDLIKAER